MKCKKCGSKDVYILVRYPDMVFWHCRQCYRISKVIDNGEDKRHILDW